MATIDPEKDIDSRQADVATLDLYGLFLANFKGFSLVSAMQDQAKNDKDADLKATAKLVEKAIRASLADMHLMLVAVAQRKKARKGQFKVTLASGELSELQDKGFTNEDLLLDLCRRLDAGWNNVPAEVRKKATKDVKMIGVTAAGTTPSWEDLLEVMGELLDLDVELEEGSTVDDSVYEPILSRFESAGAAKSGASKKAGTTVSARKPGPNDEIHPYSPKSTFEIGQFVKHPKFGVGTVVEAGAHVVIEFEEGQKRLAHIQQFRSLTPEPPKNTAPKTTAADVAAAAAKQGIEIQRLPPVPTGED